MSLLFSSTKKITLFICTTMLLTLSLSLTGCDVVNCVINNHPEFTKNSVNSATLNQLYEDSIEASISNSLEDRKYNYTFELEGDLPEGITYTTFGDEIIFSGTPTQLGDFPFRLSVVATKSPLPTGADPLDAPEDLCNDTESREMTFSVVQGN